MKILLIINDAPYGSEKAYNALRMAMMLQKEHSDVEVRVFLMADAVTCAIPAQTTAQGYYYRADAKGSYQQRWTGESLWDLLRGARDQGACLD